MPLSWNEIKSRAIAFSKEWENTEREEADAKEFLIEFLNVFGVTRRRVATFEHKVKKLNEAGGYIDLLWQGMLLVEMKSKGKDLEKAYIQAKEYCHGLKEYELPKLIVVSDFHHFHVYNEEGEKTSFVLPDLIKQIQLFAPLAGYQKRIFKEQDPVNIQAAERMGKLHDKLKAIGYEGHSLELYLVRLLFCLFADDTGIFDKGIFLDWIEDKTKEDGSDLASNIAQLFQVLNTPEDKRLKVLDESIAAFPYVNGKLFEENLPVAAFDSQMRKLLLDCCALDWSKISPAIFGSLFQSVMDEKARRNLGAHYTSEKNILELEIVRLLLKGQQVTSINDYFLIDVDQFYGIEYEEFPSQIAPVAMWLMDHQLNAMASLQFGEYFKRIPLKKSATIVHGNALRIDWQSLIEPLPFEKHLPRYHYILGNPPFLGTSYQSSNQKDDMKLIFSDVNSFGMLDYVTAWYIKAANYLKQYQAEEKDLPKTKIAFVSTNSISQGEQVGILWNELFNKYKVKIHFAHRTFKWGNEARANAAVHVVIIGFSNLDINEKLIYEYDNVTAEPHEIKVKNINPYLVEASDNFLQSISNPICNIPKMQSGSAARDGGFLILTDPEKQELVSKNSKAEKFFKRFISGDDFLNNITRWCIWLKGSNPVETRDIKEFQEKFKEVKAFREKSTRNGTKKMAVFPYLFAEERQPNHDFLIIPKVSSENRKYIPIAYLTKENIVSDKTFVVPDTTSFHFGILTSLMHNTWMRYTCGRLKSDYSYSNTIVYNNFPWPENPTDKQKETVEKAAQAVLDARVQFPDSSLADLYDPNTMPPLLVKAHQALDKAVDLCYRPQPFVSEAKRIEFLFELYDKFSAGLFVKEKKKVKIK